MKTKHVYTLLTLLGEKEKQPLDHFGFGKISQAMCADLDSEPISQRYLYDLYRKTNRKLAADIDSSSPRTYHIDLMVKYLGFSSFSHFASYQENKISNSLKSCIGNWWSYVRANSGELLFKAPVQIRLDDLRNRLSMELRSNGHLFYGAASEASNCLTCSLDSINGKTLALVFKLGNSSSFQLLQGVFCGISSAGDPISGREILLREEELSYEEMKWEQLSLKDEKTDPRILSYFSSYTQNCIKTKGVSSFTLTDLEPEAH